MSDHRENFHLEDSGDLPPGGGLPAAMRPEWQSLRGMIAEDAERAKNRISAATKVLAQPAEVLVAETDKITKDIVRVVCNAAYGWHVTEAESYHHWADLLKSVRPSILVVGWEHAHAESLLSKLHHERHSLHAHLEDLIVVCLCYDTWPIAPLDWKGVSFYHVDVRSEGLGGMIRTFDEVAGVRRGHQFWSAPHASSTSLESMIKVCSALTHVSVAMKLSGGRTIAAQEE